jgi:hypothetical protein
MRLSLCAAACGLLLAGPALADDKPKPNALTPKEIADGWLLLFDGETTFGWKVDGNAEVKDGKLVVGGQKDSKLTTTTVFPWRTFRCDFTTPRGQPKGTRVTGPKGEVIFDARPGDSGRYMRESNLTVAEAQVGPVTIEVPAGQQISFTQIAILPGGAKPLFNGKTLDGWKVFAGDPKRTATKFEVTKDGELGAKNGPGDLQTEKQFDNFVLQLECKTNGKWLNSGVFFRCIPDQYQNGYEMQIQNGYIGEDRTRPVDYGTGAIYRRVPARKVVSNDNEWFTLTLVADGAHVSTWVNGYQTVDWTDDRKPSDNPRQGLKTGKGHLSIQGHDPTTDLLFRNIRLAELGKKD